MKERDLQNQRLDRIGRKMLEAARVRDEEIEKIIHAPQLFNAVKARIKTEEQSRRKPKRFFGDWAARSASFWNRQTAAAAFTILIVLTAGAAVIIFKKQDSPQLAEQTIKPEMRPQVARDENPSPPLGIKKTTLPATKNRVKTERIALKSETAKLPIPVRKPNPVKPSQSPKKQQQEIFYSLGIGGHWEASGEDLQIVRAELSRSELFALGVNLPPENEAPKIKTDLLVGADGVARAFRFVEKF